MSRNWGRFAPLTGVVFVILVLISAFLPGDAPDSNATGAAVIAYAKSNQSRIDITAVVIAVSLLFGLLFYGELRRVLRQDPDNESLATVSFGGAVLFAAAGGLSGGLSLALADVPSKLDPAAAQTLNILLRDVPMVMFSGIGILMVAAGLAIVRSRVLAVWLGWAGIVLGLIAVLPLGFIALILGAVWTLVTSIVLTMRVELVATEETGSSATLKMT